MKKSEIKKMTKEQALKDIDKLKNIIPINNDHNICR